MREIKFRAWDKERKEMMTVKLMDFSQWWISCDPTYGQAKPLEYGERNSFKNEPTDRHILMQYTSLKDKNGKEIYEGDIVDDSYINPMTDRKVINQYIVEWDGIHRMKFIEGRKGLDRYLWMQAKNVQVIGNIYETPELLQEEANG